MKTLVKNVQVINEGNIKSLDVLIIDEKISQIAPQITVEGAVNEINGEGKYLMPGVIDDQVHFREPGLTHKANIYSESRAAVAGGTTSFMEMPNTKPPATSQEELQKKYDIAKVNSLANYSFFMGASNDNYDEVMKTNISDVCGVKIFMGSSTGNMLVDNEKILERLFANVPCIIATHCEDEERIRERKAEFSTISNHARYHPIIRDDIACYLSSEKAIELAKKHNTRLHVLHISTERELQLFDNQLPLEKKRITAEVCVHHLSLNADSYDSLGNKMQCNPAIKSATDQSALWEALLADKLDIIATDHAPHTIEEKAKDYGEAPSGLPLVQHALQLMLDHHDQNRISLEDMVRKMCHAPAQLFEIEKRGFIREGYYADLVLIDKSNYTINEGNILYKCAWSPFYGRVFDWSILKTWVNGHLAFENGSGLNNSKSGMRLNFHRN